MEDKIQLLHINFHYISSKELNVKRTMRVSLFTENYYFQVSKYTHLLVKYTFSLSECLFKIMNVSL